MAHPFSKLFEIALKESTGEDNVVLKEAEKLLEKGYPRLELVSVLKQMFVGRIDENEASILRESVEALEEDEY